MFFWQHLKFSDVRQKEMTVCHAFYVNDEILPWNWKISGIFSSYSYQQFDLNTNWMKIHSDAFIAMPLIMSGYSV